MELQRLKLTKRRSELLQRYNVKRVEDILRIYPFRYEKRQVVPFEQWKIKENVCFEGLICSNAQVIRLGQKRTMTRFRVISWNQELQLTLFNRPWTNMFVQGKKITVFGIYQGKGNVTVTTYNTKPLEQQVGIQPVYSLVEGMRQQELSQIIRNAFELVKSVKSVIPERYQKKYRLMDMYQALYTIHYPKDDVTLHQAVRTLKYEEFLSFQCVMQALHKTNVELIKTPKVFKRSDVENFLNNLPYELTIDQQKAIEEVLNDLASTKIMFRMVQGDVGCGKTQVAITALYACQKSGVQACLLAPTLVLAMQHVKNLKAQGIDACLYSSDLSLKEKEKVKVGLANGSILISVGTHALFQEDVKFHNLGLVIVDEQQRFGVRQRRSLLEKGKMVDFLMMSATPIPRTAAHFLFGDMDISDIHTMPSGRLPVITKYVAGKSMAPFLIEVLDFVKEGQQGYVICPSIEDNDSTDLRSALSIYDGMKKTLKQFQIGLLHGKMKADEKEKVMESFKNKEIDILVSTTVVEVGVDVPNATWMVIYDAHRFGLSTLHQLRGRVARSSRQGHCYLLSTSKDPQAQARLKMLEECADGFSITEYDLQTRGPGDVLGLRQSGVPGFLFGDLQKDKAMIECCIQDAREILDQNQDQAMLELVKQALENASYFD